ncbi:ATP-dependent DNA helicase DinG [Gilvimarinus sp. F26214L]|uniref:ATP-dependent DNA helicase DinG n=1 Tax=Gilvimarinus sp. DZF01 TaxID=3461371 RepID=UPI004046235D
MLSTETKQQIQQAYSQFLESRELRARYGQKLMIAEIARTLGGIELDDEGQRRNNGHICVIEAGTGTGKTVAYFLAALPIARALGKHLVVSTATVALQEQIVHKDLPELKKHSELAVNYSLAKGRGRYLCLARLDRQLNEFQAPQELPLGVPPEEQARSDEETVRLYHSMMDALSTGKWDGDRDNWPKALDDDQWRPVTTNHRQCSGRRCSFVSSCSFFKSREQIQGVDCIVTNHDLVLADLALGGGAILPSPEDTIYIFDEAHHLADKARNHFSQYSRLESTQKWLDECRQSLEPAAREVGEAGDLKRKLEQLPDVLSDCKRQLTYLQPLLLDCLETAEAAQEASQQSFNRRSNHYRFAHGIVPGPIVEAAAEATQSFGRLVDILTQASEELAESLDQSSGAVPRVDLENWFPVFGSWLARAEANLALWMSYASNDVGEIPDARWVEKIETNSGMEVGISSSPILAAHTLDELLWSRCCGAVLTSATLTALGRFDRLVLHTGTPADSNYKIVPSPFDYSKATLRIPKEARDAGDAFQHTESLIQNLPQLLNRDEGNLVLFSSRRQMLDVYDGLESSWQQLILVQDDRSKQETLAEHKRRLDSGQGSIIFGLASFAEGVDLPGKYCSHVVVAKIPFSVPDDPVESALAEWIKDRGGNPFMEISVPDASLKLIQACGRLIRSESDTGTITIMDRRLTTRHYGKAILDSLPGFVREV